jgi:peptide deformylase
LTLKIVQAGDPVLRAPARSLTVREIAGPDVQSLIQEMRKTMYEAPGVGLAAPQVGIPLQIAVIEDREGYLENVPAEELEEKERRPVPFHVLVNPRIVHSGDGTREFYEGCLSLTGFSALVARAGSVRVECLNESGEPRLIEASGWYARILQHEIDHLNGTLYIDRMNTRTFTSLENWDRFWRSSR